MNHFEAQRTNKLLRVALALVRFLANNKKILVYLLITVVAFIVKSRWGKNFNEVFSLFRN